VVKVIWRKTASLPQIDGSIVFARWRPCALPCGHIGITRQIRQNLCYLPHTPKSTTKRQIHWFSHFCAAHARQKVPVLNNVRTFPPKLSLFIRWSDPHLIHDRLGHSKPIIQSASQSVQLFSHRRAECHHTLQRTAPSPLKNAPFHGGSEPYLIHGSLGPPKSSTQTASRSVQLFLQGSLVWQTDRQTTLLGR